MDENQLFYSVVRWDRYWSESYCVSNTGYQLFPICLWTEISSKLVCLLPPTPEAPARIMYKTETEA